MSVTRTLIASAALVSITIGLAPSRVDACSLPDCVLPRAHPAASIPANASGVWAFPGGNWRYGDTFGHPESLSLRVSTLEGDATLETTVVDRAAKWDIRAALRADLGDLEGETLTLVSTGRCADWDPDEPREPSVVESWTIGPPAAKPHTLGMLEVTLDAHGEGLIPDGPSCAWTFPAATAHVALIPSEEAEPWLDVVVFETLVDGELHHILRSDWYSVGTDFYGEFGGSWKGRGEDALFTRCASDDPDFADYESYIGLPPGEHTVVMRAIVPDGTVIETPPITVMLECPSVQEAGGCSATSSGSASTLVFLLGLAFLARRRRNQPGMPPRFGPSLF
jgi:uncharacterized protein (TIGR03382 family)